MKTFFRELIIVFLLSTILILILSLLIAKTDISEAIIVPGIISISSITIMFRSNKTIKGKNEKRHYKWCYFGSLLYVGNVFNLKCCIKRFFFEFKIIYNDFFGDDSRNDRRNCGGELIINTLELILKTT